MALRSSVYIFVFALLVAALGGCGHSGQALKGEKGLAQSTVSSKGQTAGSEGKMDRSGAGKEVGRSSLEKSTRDLATLNDVYFDFDQYLITSEDVDVLTQDLGWFKANPAARVKIEGYCDERGSIEYNLALGQKRADATRNYIMRLGVPGNRLETVSYGKEKPFDPGHTEAAWAKNRRAHLKAANQKPYGLYDK
jgi:peptidoglycan-associated lipoprotein